MQPFIRTPRRRLIALGAGAALALGIAQAQTAAPAPAPASSAAAVSTGPQLTIREIDDSSGRCEVKARNAQGARVKLYVNASSGAVERTRD